METGKAVALAGIAATAVVGIAGATASWLIARDDRANQRALAHDDRVYDRRADAYLAALAVIERQRLQIARELVYLDNGGPPRAHRPPRRPTLLRMATDDDPLIPRLTAFGSRRIVTAYERLGAFTQGVSNDEWDGWNRWRSLNLSHRAKKWDGPNLGAELSSKLFDDLDAFDERKRQFELLVQHELS